MNTNRTMCVNTADCCGQMENLSIKPLSLRTLASKIKVNEVWFFSENKHLCEGLSSTAPLRSVRTLQYSEVTKHLKGD